MKNQTDKNNSGNRPKPAYVKGGVPNKGDKINPDNTKENNFSDPANDPDSGIILPAENNSDLYEKLQNEQPESDV